MRHDHRRPAPLLVALHRARQRHRPFRVQVRIRLVHHHHHRRAVERAGERDALALSARQGRPARRFTGRLSRNLYREVLLASSVHVYLTIPFVLSWSMIEAMSAGCLLPASDTDPVREVVRDGENGLLVDFFDTGVLAERICATLDRSGDLAPLRDAARRTAVGRYSAAKLVPQRARLLEAVADGLMDG